VIVKLPLPSESELPDCNPDETAFTQTPLNGLPEPSVTLPLMDPPMPSSELTFDVVAPAVTETVEAWDQSNVPVAEVWLK